MKQEFIKFLKKHNAYSVYIRLLLSSVYLNKKENWLWFVYVSSSEFDSEFWKDLDNKWQNHLNETKL